MNDIQRAIMALRLEGSIEITGRPKRVAEFFGGLEVAISAMQELQQYRQIGKVEQIERLAEDRNTWRREAQRQAAAAGELKIALAERLSETNRRLKSAREARQGTEDSLQRLICDWQIDRLNAEKVWLEGLINGKEDRHGIR